MLDLSTKNGIFELAVQEKADKNADRDHFVQNVGFIFFRPSSERRETSSYSTARPFHPNNRRTPATVTFALSGPYDVLFRRIIQPATNHDFDGTPIEDFWHVTAANAWCALHVVVHRGSNTHHNSDRISRLLR